MSAKSTILVVDSNRTNLGHLSQQLEQAGYDTLTAASLEELDRVMQEKETIALVLLDISGFDYDVWERCEELGKARAPCIVIAPQRSPEAQRETVAHGARGLLVKPIDFNDLMEHIHGVLGD